MSDGIKAYWKNWRKDERISPSLMVDSIKGVQRMMGFWQCEEFYVTTDSEGRCIIDVEKYVDVPRATLPDVGTLVGGQPLEALRRLREVALPEGLDEVGDNWFADCKTLKRVTVPASVRRLGRQAFYLCSMLIYVTFAEGSLLETIEERCFQSSRLKGLALPDGLRWIRAKAFQGCEYLRVVSVSVQGRLHGIGERCFWGSGLEEITLPSALTLIDRGAFDKCENLKIVCVYDECPIHI